jgi:hypothetical protein
LDLAAACRTCPDSVTRRSTHTAAVAAELSLFPSILLTTVKQRRYM